MSPSTRRAWIEIAVADRLTALRAVALHPEGVDRNVNGQDYTMPNGKSPSTRRAWIEIT